jgi:plasmid stabilization system protein ParE
MNKYDVYLSNRARQDLVELSDFIYNVLKSPLTSKRYTDGIIKEILKLKTHANSIQLYNRKSTLKYGYNVRRVNYKKHAILYTINNNIVIIQRIIVGSLISEI